MTKSQAVATVRNYVPEPVMAAIRPLRRFFYRAQFTARYGFRPPPELTGGEGYEAVIGFIQGMHTLDLPGDVVEVGAFCGGGTYKLARFLSRNAAGKKVYVIDCFSIDHDNTECTAGARMSDLYAGYLRGRSQKEVFDCVTRGLHNIEIIPKDSKLAVIPAEVICFAYVDGNHAPAYVRNDFSLVWSKLTPGGVVAFHDYGYDLPQVTATLDELCAQHREEISRRSVHKKRHILFIQKRST
jgi:predicted O-methyltransferase YrrM